MKKFIAILMFLFVSMPVAFSTSPDFHSAYASIFYTNFDGLNADNMIKSTATIKDDLC
ncbi:MAG: hypothetical protein FWE01_01215 [Firmicutes bacterium]|nr:hypothetical protein [Bacillota bacterium]